MKRILLMRHSVAEHGSSDITDEERSLTAHGLVLIKAQALKLQQASILPDLLISSHAIRANYTATILAEHLGFTNQIKVEPFLYHDFTTQQFINYLHNLPDTCNTVLFVGHNPTISTLLLRLTTANSILFPPAAIAIVKSGFNQWKSVTVGKCELEHYLLP